MLSRAWGEVMSGDLLDPRGQPPGYYAALVSHRALRYAAGPLHLTMAVASLRLARRDQGARFLLALQLCGAVLALLGRRSSRVPLGPAAWYYAVVNAASVVGLARALARGGDTTWTPERR
jgi:multisubunit Na+/H+ antiporter MnhF subunit